MLKVRVGLMAFCFWGKPRRVDLMVALLFISTTQHWKQEVLLIDKESIASLPGGAPARKMEERRAWSGFQKTCLHVCTAISSILVKPKKLLCGTCPNIQIKKNESLFSSPREKAAVQGTKENEMIHLSHRESNPGHPRLDVC